MKMILNFTYPHCHSFEVFSFFMNPDFFFTHTDAAQSLKGITCSAIYSWLGSTTNNSCCSERHISLIENKNRITGSIIFCYSNNNYHYLFQAIQFIHTVLIQLIQLSISTDFVYTAKSQDSSILNNQFSVSKVFMSKTVPFQTIKFADGFLQESEWQQINSGRKVTSQNSRRS